MPRDASWAWGLYDSLIVVIPGLDLVVARAGSAWERDAGAGRYDVLRPFLGPIVAAVRTASALRSQPDRNQRSSASVGPGNASAVAPCDNAGQLRRERAGLRGPSPGAGRPADAAGRSPHGRR